MEENLAEIVSKFDAEKERVSKEITAVMGRKDAGMLKKVVTVVLDEW